MTLLKSALKYLDMGWCPLALCPPDHFGVSQNHRETCGSPGKAPWHKWKNFQDERPAPQDLEKLFRRNPKSNVGLALGPISGVVRVDVDGENAPRQLQEKSGGDLPATLEFSSGGGGFGLLYAIPTGTVLRTTRNKGDTDKKHQELRFQAKGAQTVLPPSIHPSGRVYQWESGRSPDDIAAALAPDWLIRELSPRKPKSAEQEAREVNEVAEPSYPQYDNVELAREAVAALSAARATDRDQWLAVGMGLHDTDDSLLSVWEGFSRRCPDKYREGECQEKWSGFTRGGGIKLGTIIKWAEEDGWQAPWKKNGAAKVTYCDQSDLGNARRLVRLRGDKLRFCHPWDSWLVWDERRWAVDDTGHAERMAKDVADQLWREAAAKDDSGLRRFAAETAESGSISAMLRLARSEPGIPILPKQLDTDPGLLNCMNGTLDLRTGELRRPKREDLITKLCPTAYVPTAESYHWDRFLEAVFVKQTLIDFVLRFLGYCLTGDVREQILAIFWGSGSNGKSTLLKAYMQTLGTDYACKAVPELLLTKRNESHPTERADLFGKRFVACVETSDGRAMNEALVKELTGGDSIKARRLYEDLWEFEPTHKPVLCTNHRPRITGSDHAIWRRLALIPFVVTFWDPKNGETGPAELAQDKSLPGKLTAEAEGILASCVRGCLEWQRSGLILPTEVQSATAEYRSAEDTVGAFIAECCMLSPICKVKATPIYEAYRKWSEARGEAAMSQRAFGDALTEKGFTKSTSNGVWYSGIGLINESRESA